MRKIIHRQIKVFLKRLNYWGSRCHPSQAGSKDLSLPALSPLACCVSVVTQYTFIYFKQKLLNTRSGLQEETGSAVLSRVLGTIFTSSGK